MPGETDGRWHTWTSDRGRLYATGTGMSAHMPGASVTVDATTEDGLSAAIAAAERDNRRAAGLWAMLGRGC